RLVWLVTFLALFNLTKMFLLPAHSADAVPAYVSQAVNDGGRTVWNRARDTARKPADILAFSQIKPGMIVIDLVPQDGYYTRMLAKLVGPNGKVYAIVPGGGGGGGRSSRIAQREGQAPSNVPVDLGQACSLGCYDAKVRAGYMLPVDELFAIENIAEYKNVTVLWEGVGSGGGDIAIPEQADAIFTADGYHMLHATKGPQLPASMQGRQPTFRPINMAVLNKKAFGALKNGGLYIVVDHAAAKGKAFGDADAL